MIFKDRAEAGRRLANALRTYGGRSDVIVLGLPRGGIPVAFEVARALPAPLDVFLVRKLGVPGREELAMGAIASGGVRVLNADVVRALRVSDQAITAAVKRESEELRRREREYRGGRDAPELGGQTVILVDDGLATGASMKAAVLAVRQERPARVVVAAPVAAASTCAELRAEADEVVCLRTPEPFLAVGRWYLDFPQTTDDEVRDSLSREALQPAAAGAPGRHSATTRTEH